MKNISYNIYKKVVQRHSTPTFLDERRSPCYASTYTYLCRKRSHFGQWNFIWRPGHLFMALCKGLFFLIESFFIFFFFQVKIYCTWHYSSSVHHMFVQFSTTNQGIVRSTEIIIIFDTYCMKFDWKRDDWCFLFFHATVQTWCGFIRTKFVSLNPIIQCVMYISIHLVT